MMLSELWRVYQTAMVTLAFIQKNNSYFGTFLIYGVIQYNLGRVRVRDLPIWTESVLGLLLHHREDKALEEAHRSWVLIQSAMCKGTDLAWCQVQCPSQSTLRCFYKF